jgi:hypothetical protein
VVKVGTFPLLEDDGIGSREMAVVGSKVPEQARVRTPAAPAAMARMDRERSMGSPKMGDFRGFPSELPLAGRVRKSSVPCIPAGLPAIVPAYGTEPVPSAFSA